MPALFLPESEVSELLTMPHAIESIEHAFLQLALGKAVNVPRTRVAAPGILLHCMSASASHLGYLGWKSYTTTDRTTRFHIALYEVETGKMSALFEADQLGRIRTGAASGVATKYMARTDARRVGIFGTGRQARTQLLAICQVRDISRVHVYCRTEKSRATFSHHMAKELGISVVPVSDPEQAVKDMDIIITSTTSEQPLFDGRSITQGTHLNLIGSNFLHKSEVDICTIERADHIVCDSVEQCKLEAGDLVIPIKQKILNWSKVLNLSDVITQPELVRSNPSEITVFKSVGLAIEDVAVGVRVLKRAQQEDRGQLLPF